MNELSLISKAIRTMSSREMADLTEKRHDNVKRTIDTLAEKGVITFPQIVETSFEGVDGRKQTVTEYLIGKRDSFVVVAQLSPEFTARLVDRWQELEAQVAQPVALSTMDILKLAMEAEQGRLQAIEQRDHAIATKAQIGDKKVATAMATASAKSRENTKLRERMGEAAQSASVMAVESKTKGKFAWRPLRDYCNASELHMGNSWNPGMQISVKTYPAAAWLAVYGVDLAELFGEVTA